MAENAAVRCAFLFSKGWEKSDLNIPQGFGGGPLGIHVGNDLSAAGVILRSLYGGTEFGPPFAAFGTPEQAKLRESADWDYVTFSSGLGEHVRWVPQGDGTFECQFLVSIQS